MIYAVIMAGGSGTRFWPRSTAKTPKQFLKLFGSRTMIQATVDRLDGFIPEHRSLVVTNDQYVQTVKEQLPGIPESFIIGEPVARNTAPCVAAAAQILYNSDPDAVMVVLPSDHQILNEKQFRSTLKIAAETALKQGSLVTIGITPERPETGYGYIRVDKTKPADSSSAKVFEVKNFTEKPDQKTAIEFLQSGEYLWNSGMFVWKAETILTAFRLYQKAIYSALDLLAGDPGSVTPESINRFYQACPSISVDYGIMEKADKVHVLPGDFGWNDVGSWAAVHDLAEKDASGNSARAKAISIHDSDGNLIDSESSKLIALVGVKNLAVVETERAILVCDLKRSQDVKKVVEHLKSDPGLHKYI